MNPPYPKIPEVEAMTTEITEQEREQASAMEDMGQLLDESEIRIVRRNEIVEGEVLSADAAGGLLVDIGQKSEAVVPPNEMRTMNAESVDALVGSVITAMVMRPESADRPAVLSVDKAVGEQGWIFLEKAHGSGETIIGRIAGFNRGGSIVEVEGVQGFVPMSQLVSVPRERFRLYQDSEQQRLTDDERRELQAAQNGEHGKELSMKVLEVNRQRNRAIFSEREAVKESREALKAKLIQDLEEGQIKRGTVTGISSFGAFVDIGGADGLIHISELSWSMVNTPEEVVRVGQELDVYVLRVDAESKKIALSLRRLQPEPWETIHERFNIGDVVSATVTKLTNFGAFARVEDSIEGLIHISELSPRMINHPREVVSEGQQIFVKILRIEPERRRLGLSLKQAERYF